MRKLPEKLELNGACNPADNKKHVMLIFCHNAIMRYVLLHNMIDYMPITLEYLIDEQDQISAQSVKFVKN